MARADHLPIYKKTYDLVLMITKVVKNFPRDYKLVLGKDLIEQSRDIVLMIYRVNNSSTDRLSKIIEILERMELIMLSLRLCKDMHFISIGQFARLSNLNVEICKQAEGWKKSEKRKQAPIGGTA
ncbi:four helix bundle protein [Thiomicrorhabdus indica]|uniref:four helix bundle protein n=1 Tax=Thiomicrorhabdus indica TaxID=2267253 RepID=UPI00102DB441|nr:four helix bundle protein [Thiomicrorhabdus indica]